MSSGKRSVGLAGPVLNRARRPFEWRRFRADYGRALRGRSVRLNLSLATPSLPGWVDAGVLCQGTSASDLSRPWPVESNSVHFIYVHDLIERFVEGGGRAALRAAFDVLVPGGVLRLVMPPGAFLAEWLEVQLRAVGFEVCEATEGLSTYLELCGLEARVSPLGQPRHLIIEGTKPVVSGRLVREPGDG